MRKLFAVIYILVVVCAGCNSSDSSHSAIAGGAPHFNPDYEHDATTSDQLLRQYGPIPSASKPYRIGAVMKFLGNHYWQLLADGMASKINELGGTLDVRAAASESDEAGQLKNMQSMVELGYDAIFVSPQTNTNLMSAVQAARRNGILIINVDDAVLDDAEHFVGPNQYENGVRAAKYMMQRYPAGGSVGLIRGVQNSYAVVNRSQGFIDTLKDTTFRIVADEYGQWDLQMALEKSAGILQKFPDVVGFYCNNDIMALGVVQAVKSAQRSAKTIVIGTDGIGPAYDSIRAGELAATIDSFPFKTGEVAVEVAIRLLEGQKLPRVVFSPQDTISVETVENILTDARAY